MNECMNTQSKEWKKWINEQVNDWETKLINKWMDAEMNEWMNECIDNQLNQWKNDILVAVWALIMLPWNDALNVLDFWIMMSTYFTDQAVHYPCIASCMYQSKSFCNTTFFISYIRLWKVQFDKIWSNAVLPQQSWSFSEWCR